MRCNPPTLGRRITRLCDVRCQEELDDGPICRELDRIEILIDGNPPGARPATIVHCINETLAVVRKFLGRPASEMRMPDYALEAIGRELEAEHHEFATLFQRLRDTLSRFDVSNITTGPRFEIIP